MVGQAVDTGYNHPRGSTVIVKFWNAPFQKMEQVFCKGKYSGLLDEITFDEFSAASEAERSAK